MSSKSTFGWGMGAVSFRYPEAEYHTPKMAEGKKMPGPGLSNSSGPNKAYIMPQDLARPVIRIPPKNKSLLSAQRPCQESMALLERFTQVERCPSSMSLSCLQ